MLLSGRSAFVVEDDPLILFGLSMVLEEHDIEIVASASTLAEALTAAATVVADVALLDVNLDGESVYPAADALIERGIPVILVTGYSGGEIFPPRFADVPVINKPYHADTLVATIERCFAAPSSRS